MEPEEARARLRELAAQGEELDLFEGALLVATTGRPDLDLAAVRAQLQALVSRARERLREFEGGPERLDALLRFVYQEQGFVGDEADYHHPRNSHVDQVLSRRAGIPISLAVVLVELGRRLGVPLAGVGFPGHFLVRFLADPPTLLDPFAGGRRLTEQDCRELFRRVTGGGVRFDPRCLLPAPRREVLARMLRNLKGAHLRRGELDQALEATTRLLLVDPEAHEELRDRGRLRLRQGDLSQGREDLLEYLRRAPQAPDRTEVQGELERAQARLWSLN